MAKIDLRIFPAGRAFRASDRPVTVFAERGRRVESFSFKLFYGVYRLLHWMLTGRTIRFGNFSLLPRRHIDSIVAYPELWNHYAAAVLKARIRTLQSGLIEESDCAESHR